MSASFFDDENKDRYSFSYMSDDGERDITHTFRCDNAETWPTVLQEFLSFLNGVYGYDVSSKVRIEANPFGIEGRWGGGTYDPDEHPLASFRKGEKEADNFPEARE